MPHLSASQLETFLQCPSKWRAQYVEQVKGDPSEALGLGSALHTVLENFGRHRLARKSATIDPAAMKREFSHELRKVLAETDPHGKLLKASEHMEMRGHAMLEAFCRDIAPIYWPVEVENSFDFDLPNVDAYQGDKWNVVGRIDARTLTSDGVTTVDWKTGKKWRNGAEHTKVQATVYLLSELLTGRPVSSKVTFITFPTEWDDEKSLYTCAADVRPTTRTLYQVSETLQTLRNAAREINEIRNGKIPTPKPSYLCPWCPIVERCHTGQTFLVERNRRARVTVNENNEPLTAGQDDEIEQAS